MDPPVDVTRCQAPVQGPSGIVNECFSSTEKLASQRLFHFRNKKPTDENNVPRHLLFVSNVSHGTPSRTKKIKRQRKI